MSNYSKYTDQELAQYLRAGDHDAFAEIYNRFFGLLYIHAFRKLADEEEANDLLQDMFATLWDKRDAFLLSTNLSAYLYTATRNRILNIIEHRKVNDKYIDSLSAYATHDYKFADHKIRESDLKKLIETEVNALPAQMRRIFMMSRTEHLSYKEIAEKLDLSEQAIKSQMKRALKTLRVKLGLFTFLMVLIKYL